MATALPNQERGSIAGVGIGLRDPHFEQLMSGKPPVLWVELLADNFVVGGAIIQRQLARIAERYPVTLHCVGMNLGGLDPLDWNYLSLIKKMAAQTQAAWVSDHLCFSAVAGRQYHDLLPLPYTDEAVLHIAQRIIQVQDFLQQRIAVENVSSYVLAKAPLNEAEFVLAVCQEADCDLLLDVNNLYVNQINLGLDATKALDLLPQDRVREIHLGGYQQKEGYLIDAHNNPVSDPVWALFSKLAQHISNTPVCIEWDNDIPALSVLLAEAAKASTLLKGAMGKVA